MPWHRLFCWPHNGTPYLSWLGNLSQCAMAGVQHVVGLDTGRWKEDGMGTRCTVTIIKQLGIFNIEICNSCLVVYYCVEICNHNHHTIWFPNKASCEPASMPFDRGAWETSSQRGNMANNKPLLGIVSVVGFTTTVMKCYSTHTKNHTKP